MDYGHCIERFTSAHMLVTNVSVVFLKSLKNKPDIL